MDILWGRRYRINIYVFASKIASADLVFVLPSFIHDDEEIPRSRFGTASEGPHSLFSWFVQIETRFVQIVTKNT